MRSNEQFDLGAGPNYETNALCERLFSLLKADLSKSPMIRDTQDAYKMGFIVPSSAPNEHKSGGGYT